MPGLNFPSEPSGVRVPSGKRISTWPGASSSWRQMARLWRGFSFRSKGMAFTTTAEKTSFEGFVKK